MKKLFTHLNLRSSYSLVDSTINLNSLIKRAKSQKMSTLALTDFTNIFNLVKFYQKSIENKIKPILGCQIPLMEFNNKYQNPYITLLCKNYDGYKNMIKILSDAHVNSDNILSTTSIKKLSKFSEHLIILSGGREGILGRNLLQADLSSIYPHIENLKSIFNDNLYIEIQNLSSTDEYNYKSKCVELAEKFEVPLVATNAVRFIEKDDFRTHEVKVCINKKIKLEERGDQQDYTEEQYLKSYDEMNLLFDDFPDALENVSEIIMRCNTHIPINNTDYLPIYSPPKNFNVDTYFTHKVEQGMNKILSSVSDTDKLKYRERLETETNVITKMDYVSYFLIVHEFISWAKDNDIPVGPGRGSGAGSLIAYALGITSIDPIKHNLLFERFLNIERVSLPDFDIDFCKNNRQKIIDHITDLYGANKVSQIITYGTLMAKQAIRDVGRVIGLPYLYVDRIAKMIPFSVDITIDEAIKQNKELKKEYESKEEVKTLIDLSKKLEGLPRNPGKHAAGIVISPDVIDKFVPLYRIEESNELVTQFDKDDIEKLGLVKFDILGLRTLSIIKKTIEDIKNIKGDIVNLETISMTDKSVFKLMQNKLTTGVFQLESPGMKRYMGQLKPDCFDDIVALVALYRPGPLGTNMVDDFIENKHGKKIVYEHPHLEPILSSTYGLILYQEQVMEIAKTLANYTLGEADILRRAMGKKKKKEMETQRKKFIDGAKINKIDFNIAESIFSKMEKFAGYGFNKSHSVAYAYISYQTAFLKTYYPSIFLASALSSDMDNTDKILSLTDSSSEHGIKIIQPSINNSEYSFVSLSDTEIIFGLGAIKGVGYNAAEHIIQERSKNGNYKNIFDFCERVSHHIINIGTMDALIYSGAFDDFDCSRYVLKELLNKAISYGNNKQNNKQLGQKDLFSSESSADDIESLINLDNYQIIETREQRLQSLSDEKRVIGLHLSGHPINEYKAEISSMSIKPILSYISDFQTQSLIPTDNIILCGVITKQRLQKIGKDKYIKILTVDDSSSRIEIILYSESIETNQETIIDNQLYFITGQLSFDDYSGSLNMKASSIMDLEKTRTRYSKGIELLIKESKTNDDTLEKLSSILEPHKNGKCPVIIKCVSNNHVVPMKLNNEWHINPTTDIIDNLGDLLGSENIIVKYH